MKIKSEADALMEWMENGTQLLKCDRNLWLSAYSQISSLWLGTVPLSSRWKHVDLGNYKEEIAKFDERKHKWRQPLLVKEYFRLLTPKQNNERNANIGFGAAKASFDSYLHKRHVNTLTRILVNYECMKVVDTRRFSI